MPKRGDAADAALSALMQDARLALAARLKAAREKSQQSQIEVAEPFGRSDTWVAKLESETAPITPRADHLVGLASVMGADAAELLVGETADSWFIAELRRLEKTLQTTQGGLEAVLAVAQFYANAARDDEKRRLSAERRATKREGTPVTKPRVPIRIVAPDLDPGELSLTDRRIIEPRDPQEPIEAVPDEDALEADALERELDEQAATKPDEVTGELPTPRPRPPRRTRTSE